jgi:transcriptional coactivator HFI1/ADA1
MTETAPTISVSPGSLPSKKPLNGSETVVNGTAHSTPTINSTTIGSDKSKQSNISKRIEVDKLVTELQRKMGSYWDKYQRTTSLYLLGKLSRQEFTHTLTPLLTDSKMVRMHNQLLLANLANSLRDGPNQQMLKKSGFGGNSSSKKKKDSKVKVSSQYEKLKKTIMNLPIRERYRIKTITRDSGKRNMSTSSMTLTRQALLPKIPYVTDKDRALTGNTVEWTQDISHSLQTPLATESYTLPDSDTLESKMLGIAREHGLTGSIDKPVFELVSLGLETYLKLVLESAIDTVRYRKRKYNDDDFLDDHTNDKVKRPKIILTNEDIVDTLRISPFLFEPNGPLYRLHNVALNDDTYVEEKTPLDSYLTWPRPIDHTAISPLVGAKTIAPVGPTTGTSALLQGEKNGGTATPVAKDGKEINQQAEKTVQSVKQEPIKSSGDENKEDEIIGTKEELNWLIYDILNSK